MRSTLRLHAGGAVTVFAGEQGQPPAQVAVGISIAGRVECVSLTPEQASMLAGEIERAVWATQRQPRQAPTLAKRRACDECPGETACHHPVCKEST